MKTKYRIVTDNYAGYEVQQWRWYWPFWSQVGFTNTNFSIKDAEKWLELYLKGIRPDINKQQVVKYL